MLRNILKFIHFQVRIFAEDELTLDTLTLMKMFIF